MASGNCIPWCNFRASKNHYLMTVIFLFLLINRKAGFYLHILLHLNLSISSGGLLMYMALCF